METELMWVMCFYWACSIWPLSLECTTEWSLMRDHTHQTGGESERVSERENSPEFNSTVVNSCICLKLEPTHRCVCVCVSAQENMRVWGHDVERNLGLISEMMEEWTSEIHTDTQKSLLNSFPFNLSKILSKLKLSMCLKAGFSLVLKGHSRVRGHMDFLLLS